MEPKKNPKANLERYRFVLSLLGLSLAGAFTLLSLEHITVENEPYIPPVAESSDDDLEPDYEEEEPPEEPPEEEEPPPPPEEPPPPVDPPATDTEEAEDDDEVTTTNIVMDAPTPPPPPPPPPPPKAKIYDFPSQEATFPGGMEGMYKFLYSKITYPKMARNAGIQGRVFVEFVVDENGNVKNVKLLKGIGGGCDEQAINAVKALPKWTPAEQAGTKVQQRFKLPVKFELE